MVFHGSQLVSMVPGWVFMFLFVLGWFSMIPGRFDGFSWFHVGF